MKCNATLTQLGYQVAGKMENEKCKFAGLIPSSILSQSMCHCGGQWAAIVMYKISNCQFNGLLQKTKTSNLGQWAVGSLEEKRNGT